MSTPPPGKRLHPILIALYAIWVLAALVIATFGAWVATTLTVFHDGPTWLALVGAFTCFFLVPLLWELWADRHQKGGRVRDAILRSSVLSIVFLGVILVTHPQSTFKALATRGDWWLAGSTTPAADAIRVGLRDLADGFEWLYLLARKEGYLPDPDAASITPAPTGKAATDVTGPRPGGSVGGLGTGGSSPPSRPAPSPRDQGIPKPPGLPIVGTPHTWPLPAEVHPVAARLVAEGPKTIAAVGKALRSELEDPFERVRAIHDFTASWLDYDGELLRRWDAGEKRAAPSVEQAFASRRGVCMHYAQLAAALGKVTGDRIVYVTGDTRSARDYDTASSADTVPIDPSGHAWNAAELGGRWYLFDATWNAGHLTDYRFVRQFETTYLFAPPEVMALTHLPKERRWQLLETPLSRAEWLRQPLVNPRFVALGLTLRSPTHPIVPVDDRLTLELDNPAGFEVALSLTIDGTRTGLCAFLRGESGALTCPVPTAGRHKATVFAKTDPTQPTIFQDVGHVLFDASP